MNEWTLFSGLLSAHKLGNLLISNILILFIEIYFYCLLFMALVLLVLTHRWEVKKSHKKYTTTLYNIISRTFLCFFYKFQCWYILHTILVYIQALYQNQAIFLNTMKLFMQSVQLPNDGYMSECWFTSS